MMSSRICPECRKVVSNLQEVCENCGSTLYVKSEKRRMTDRLLALLLALALVVVALAVRD